MRANKSPFAKDVKPSRKLNKFSHIPEEELLDFDDDIPEQELLSETNMKKSHSQSPS